MANRTVTFEVYQRGKQDQISRNPAVLTVTNPQPALPTNVSIVPTFEIIFFSHTPPADLDWKGIVIWLSTSSGFTPKDNNIVYEGADTLIPLGSLAAAPTYYIRFGAYDAFGKDGMIISSEFTTTTLEIIENQIADFAVTNAKVKNLSAAKISAGNIVAEDIFLGQGAEFSLDGLNKRITIKDGQTTPVVRVKLGSLGDGISDYGLEVYDHNGQLILGADGLGLNAVGPLQLSKVAREGLFSAGDIKQTLAPDPPNGWLFLRGRSIGNAGSGASERAHVDAFDLFELLWNSHPDSLMPVSGGRGRSAESDFNLRKKLMLPNIGGRFPMGAGEGYRIGRKGGALKTKGHVLSVAEMPAHSHRALGMRSHGDQDNNDNSGSPSGTQATSTAGGGQKHSHDLFMPPFLAFQTIIKL